MKKCLSPKEIQSLLMHYINNQLNNFTDDKKENELNLPNCKYRDTDYFKYQPKILKGRPLLLKTLMNLTYCCNNATTLPHQAGVTRILKSSPACQNSYLFTRISAIPNISMSNE